MHGQHTAGYFAGGGAGDGGCGRGAGYDPVPDGQRGAGGGYALPRAVFLPAGNQKNPLLQKPSGPDCANRLSGRAAIGDVFDFKRDHSGEYQYLWDRRAGGVDGLRKDGRPVLDDGERLWRSHYHICGAELWRGAV